MTWKESFMIGIAEIDRQHRELCDRVDELYAACSKGKGTDEVMKTLDFLEAYTARHFADEEKLQIKVGYPKLKEHKAMHDQFARQVSSLKKSAVAEGLKIPTVISINNTVSSWLVNHIMKEDRQIKNYITQG